MEAREQMKKLRGELLALKEKDEEFVATCHAKNWEPECRKKEKMRGTDWGAGAVGRILVLGYSHDSFWKVRL